MSVTQLKVSRYALKNERNEYFSNKVEGYVNANEFFSYVELMKREDAEWYLKHERLKNPHVELVEFEITEKP